MKHSPTVSNSMFVVQKQYLEYWLEESEIAQSSRLIVKLFSFCILQSKCVITWTNAIDFLCCWNPHLSNWNENIWGSLLKELEQGIVASLPPQILLNPVQGRLPAPTDIHLASIRTALSFCQFLGPRCINFKNLCAHHQEEVLRIPKHPQLAKFGFFRAKLWHFQKNNVLTSLLQIFNQNY